MATSTSAAPAHGRVPRAAAIVVPVGRDGLAPPSLIAYPNEPALPRTQLRSVESAAGERLPLLSTCRPRLAVLSPPRSDTAAPLASDHRSTRSSLSDLTATIDDDDDSDITSVSGDLADDVEEKPRPTGSFRQKSSGESSNGAAVHGSGSGSGGGQSVTRRWRRGNLGPQRQQSPTTSNNGSNDFRRTAPPSALPTGHSAIASSELINDDRSLLRHRDDCVAQSESESNGQHQQPTRLKRIEKTTALLSNHSVPFSSFVPTSNTSCALLETPVAQVIRKTPLSSVAVGLIVAAPSSSVAKRSTVVGGSDDNDLDSFSDAFCCGTFGCRRRGRMSSLVQSKIYNFLERPTGWKCFAYHFSV